MNIVELITKKFNEYSIKNYKTFPGREWDGYQVDLLFKNKFIGKVTDYGNGGAVNFKEVPNDHIKRLSQLSDDPDSIESESTVLAEMIDAFVIKKTLRHDAKKKTLYITDDMDIGEYGTLNYLPCEDVKNYLDTKNGKGNWVILNSLL